MRQAQACACSDHHNRRLAAHHADTCPHANHRSPSSPFSGTPTDRTTDPNAFSCANASTASAGRSSHDAVSRGSALTNRHVRPGAFSYVNRRRPFHTHGSAPTDRHVYPGANPATG